MRYTEEELHKMVGKKIACTIDGINIKDAKLQYYDDKFYVCQNEISGSSCPDKLGYRKSWTLGGKLVYYKNNQLKNLVLLEPLTKELPIFN